MSKDKQLEFEINGNLLEVADMTWHINTINYIYIGNSCMVRNRDYAIFINGGFDIVELYYKSKRWDEIYNEFVKLCKAIKQVNSTFHKIPGNPCCVDYSKVEKIKLSNPKKDMLIITFKNKEEDLIAPINLECANERLKQALTLLKEANSISKEEYKK